MVDAVGFLALEAMAMSSLPLLYGSERRIKSLGLPRGVADASISFNSVSYPMMVSVSLKSEVSSVSTRFS